MKVDYRIDELGLNGSVQSSSYVASLETAIIVMQGMEITQRPYALYDRNNKAASGPAREFNGTDVTYHANYLPFNVDLGEKESTNYWKYAVLALGVATLCYVIYQLVRWL